jgi:hypothetical protein
VRASILICLATILNGILLFATVGLYGATHSSSGDFRLYHLALLHSHLRLRASVFVFGDNNE